MKNPYTFFTSSDYYTTSQIDTIVYNITVSGVTQQQLDDVTVTFRTSDQIDAAYSASTSTYLTLDEINATGSAYTYGFIEQLEITSKIADFTANFLTAPEIDIVFSAHTSELITEAEAQTQIDAATEVSMDYWHPAPYYERLFFTDDNSLANPYLIAQPLNSQVTIHISGNTPWVLGDNVGWLSYSTEYGTGFTDLVVTATSANSSGSNRSAIITFTYDNAPGTPKSVFVSQSGTGA